MALFAWWFQPPWWMLGSYALAAAFIALTVPRMYRLFGYKTDDEAAWLHARNLREHSTLIQRLETAREALVELKIPQGIQQANMLNAILDDYRSVVETRFVGKTFTPITYLNAARGVQEHVVQNLTDMVAVGHSLAGINRQQGQTDLYQEQQQRLTDLAAENEKLSTALTETAVEVANIRTISQFERLDTLTRLVSLAQTANNTGKQ